MQSPEYKRAIAFKAIVFEVGVVLVLIALILFVLVYFKVIRLDSFFPAQVKQQEQNVVQTINPSPTGAPAKSKSTTFKKVSVLKNLKNNNGIRYSNTTTEYEGKIVSIDLIGGKVFNIRTGTNEDYKVMIKYSAGDKGTLLTSYFSDIGLPKIEVFSKRGTEKSIPISLSDLQVSDHVIINIENSNTDDYPNDLIKATITKVL